MQWGGMWATTDVPDCLPGVATVPADAPLPCSLTPSPPFPPSSPSPTSTIVNGLSALSLHPSRSMSASTSRRLLRGSTARLSPALRGMSEGGGAASFTRMTVRSEEEGVRYEDSSTRAGKGLWWS